jgi:hypothetical protein
MGLDVNFDDYLIYVPYPRTEVIGQDLIDDIRTAEVTTSGIAHAKIADASGKENLASGVQVGITIEIADPWQLKFWDGNYVATIKDCNLVGGLSGIPVAYNAGTQVLLIQSSAATIVSQDGGGSTPAEIAAEVDTVLSSSHGAGNWEGGGGLTESGIAQAVDTQLTATKGPGPWTQNLTESGIAHRVWEEDMSLHIASGTAGEFANFIYSIEGGRWKIDTSTNQMVFYAADNVTEIARFDLFNSGGSPASDNVYERRRQS